MKNENRILSRFTALFVMVCSTVSTFFIIHRTRNPLPVPAVKEELTLWKYENPGELRHAITIEQYATLYNIDTETVRALCASGAIRGAQTFEVHCRQWLIPADAAVSISVADVAAAHRVAERTVRDWIDAGRITPPPVKINREWRISPSYQLQPITENPSP